MQPPSREEVRLVPRQIGGRPGAGPRLPALCIYGRIISGRHLYARKLAIGRMGEVARAEVVRSITGGRDSLWDVTSGLEL